MKNRVFCTCILPEHIISKHGLSFAACNFSFNLISGGGFDKVYSILPLFTGGKMEQEAFEDDRFELVYDKLRYKGGIWQKIAVLKEQWTIFNMLPKGASIWFYNLNTLNALLFILLKFFKPSVKLNVIVLDFTPVTSVFGLNRIYLKLINMAHGRICLSNSPLFKKKYSATLPGIVPANDDVLPLVEIPLPKFLLSGALNEVIAQTTMVLETFAKLPECELHITGSQNVELVKRFANKYPNIIYHEQLKFVDYLDLLHSITFQLSTRDASYPENQCNFPSKIIEALLHNRAIISTIHYPQLEGIKYFEVASDKDSFIRDIKKIIKKDANSILQYANQGNNVRQLFNTKVWNETMTKIEENK